jgi:hypothetical protein
MEIGKSNLNGSLTVTSLLQSWNAQDAACEKKTSSHYRMLMPGKDGFLPGAMHQ